MASFELSVFVVLFFTVAAKPQNCENWISRSEWNSQIEEIGGDNNPKITKVFFHHTVTSECVTKESCSAIMRSMQNFHVGLDWDDISYNFVIGGDGEVYEGRGYHNQGAHTKGHNANSISIAFIGNYMNKLPSPRMLAAAKRVIKCGRKIYMISPNYGLYGHRDGSCTLSPGTLFYSSLSSWPHWHALGELKKNC